jgi:hypothetical protein
VRAGRRYLMLALEGGLLLVLAVTLLAQPLFSLRSRLGTEATNSRSASPPAAGGDTPTTSASGSAGPTPMAGSSAPYAGAPLPSVAPSSSPTGAAVAQELARFFTAPLLARGFAPGVDYLRSWWLEQLGSGKNSPVTAQVQQLSPRLWTLTGKFLTPNDIKSPSGSAKEPPVVCDGFAVTVRDSLTRTNLHETAAGQLDRRAMATIIAMDLRQLVCPVLQVAPTTTTPGPVTLIPGALGSIQPASTPPVPGQGPTPGTTLTPSGSSPSASPSSPSPSQRDSLTGTLRSQAVPSPLEVHVVKVGDSLWRIAASRSPQAMRAQLQNAWQRIWRLNQSVVGPSPDLIYPRQRLKLPR